MLHSASQSLYPKLPSEEREKIYFGIDLLEVDSTVAKRKPVCVLSDQGKLTIRKFNHKEFEKNLQSKEGQVFVNDNLVQLVFYVKDNDALKKCVKELDSILKTAGDMDDKEKISKIKIHFNSVWKNSREFGTYSAMLKVYDRKTGNFIVNSVSKLGEIYLDTEKKYLQLKGDSALSVECKNIIDKMRKILDKMQTIYNENRDDFNHLSINTVSPVAESFEKLVSQFEEKMSQLELVKSNHERSEQLKLLENSVVGLQTDCEKLISKEAVYTEEIFNEKKEIKKEIECLFTYINDLSNHNTVSDEVIIGLKNKFNKIENNLLMLKDKVTIQPNESQNNNETEQAQREQINKHLIDKIQPTLDNIQKYLEKTSPDKASILEKIISAFSDLTQKLIAKVAINEINELIRNIKVFIEAKFELLAAPRGFFSTQGRSVEFIKVLQPELDHLVQIVNGQEQSAPSIRP